MWPHCAQFFVAGQGKGMAGQMGGFWGHPTDAVGVLGHRHRSQGGPVTVTGQAQALAGSSPKAFQECLEALRRCPCKAPGRAGVPLGAWEARARASQGNLKGHRLPSLPSRFRVISDWLACLSHAPAPGPVLGLLRCDCRASSGASLADASARSLLLFAAPAARFSLGFRVLRFRVVRPE